MNAKMLVVIALGAGAGLAMLDAASQQGGMGNGSVGHSSAMQMQAAGIAEGVIRKVDKDAGKLTIKHDAIPGMDMPPMTMVYRVNDAAMLEGFKRGDKVRFTSEKIGGAYTVIAIEKPR
jgi:Cu(I)/Ag(I) efflux system periplasmic protein CusF